MIAGLRCAVCATTVDIAVAFPWRCPEATADDPYHVLHLVEGGPVPEPIDDQNPFVRYGPRLAWWAFARANGLTAAACEALTYEVAGSFAITPFERSSSIVRRVAARRVGERRDGQRRRFSQGRVIWSASCCTYEPPRRWGCSTSDHRWRSPRAATPAWPLRPWRRKPTGRSTCTCRPGWTTPSASVSISSGRGSTGATGAMTTRPETRRC